MEWLLEEADRTQADYLVSAGTQLGDFDSYGVKVCKKYKTFLATYKGVGGVNRNPRLGYCFWTKPINSAQFHTPRRLEISLWRVAGLSFLPQ